MRIVLVALPALALAACYDPHPPSGSYACGAATHDGGSEACPDNLSCVCGLCVKNASEAACSFSISSSQAVTTTKMVDGQSVDTKTLSVAEHQQFPITVTAYADKAGTMPSSFSGSVTLSSSWGDVCVGTSGCAKMPNQLMLANGVGTQSIQLNRETISPQTAELRASFAGNVGTSGSLRINVAPPTFTDAATIAMPLSYKPLQQTQTTIGFANYAIGGASVQRAGNAWTLYYSGITASTSGGNTTGTTGIGTATSTDGMTFEWSATPLVTGPLPAQGASPPFAGELGAASAFTSALGTSVYFGYDGLALGFSSLDTISAPPGSTTFAAPTTKLSLADFPFAVTAIDVPFVMADPTPALDGGEENASILYMSAITTTTTSSTSMNNIMVVRALSRDGKTFEVDPSPLLANTLEEPVVYAPRVYLDGTVYKMFYASTTYGQLIVNGAKLTDPCTTAYYVAYATSSDGSYWVRSAANSAATHVFSKAGTTVLATSVLPAVEGDPSQGLLMYYSPYDKTMGGNCVLNGISLAKAQ